MTIIFNISVVETARVEDVFSTLSKRVRRNITHTFAPITQSILKTTTYLTHLVDRAPPVYLKLTERKLYNLGF